MALGMASQEQKLENLLETGKLFYLATVLPAQSAVVEFLWRVGSKPVRFITATGSTLKTTYTIKEGVTVTATGTAGTLFNRNRNFPDNGLVFKRYTGPTYTGGVVISTDQTGASASPGQSSDSNTVVASGDLKANTDYVVTITPSAANDINIDIFWWEE